MPHRYILRQAPDGTFAWHAHGDEDRGCPDMQLLGWGPDEKPALLEAARAWMAKRGITAEVEIAG